MNRTELQQRMANPGVTTAIGWATGLLTVGILLLAALYWPRITDGQNAQVRASQVQGCRSASAGLVTAARTDFDVARAGRDTEATHLNLLISEALVYVARQDQDGLQDILDQIEDAQERVRQAEAVVVAETDVLRATEAQHEARTRLSIEDVPAYLDECTTFTRGT